MAGVVVKAGFCAVICVFLVKEGSDAAEYVSVTPASNLREEVDKLIEDEITMKLSEDLVQSIEMKFYSDVRESLSMIIAKINMLLQNGTTFVQQRLQELQIQLEIIKKATGTKVDTCIQMREKDSTALAESAQHQMVLCGYALIGHDPSQVVSLLVAMKEMIKTRLKPIQENKKEVEDLLKICGHDHGSLKKVIKCVLAKSPWIKSAMMDVTGKLIEDVVKLTKLMVNSALHEACLIEVVRTVEDEVFELVDGVRNCAFGNLPDNDGKDNVDR